MTREKFKTNLNAAVESLMVLTTAHCSNSFSHNYRFVVRPNVLTVDTHLDQEERLFLHKLKTRKKQYFSGDKVVDLLCRNNKVPYWINTSVFESVDQWTTIELLTSRRLRKEEDLNHVVGHFPPFHPIVMRPPDHIDNTKFDINWRTRLPLSLSKKIFLSTLLVTSVLITAVNLMIFTTPPGLHYLMVAYSSLALIIFGALFLFAAKKTMRIKYLSWIFLTVSVMSFIGHASNILGIGLTSVGILSFLLALYPIWRCKKT